MKVIQSFGPLLMLIICGSQAAVPSYSSSYRYNRQYCRDTKTGRELYVGEVYTKSGQCMRVQCLGTLELWEDSCQVPSALTGDCNAVPANDALLDYPKCCPLYECKTYISNSQGKVEQINTYDHYGNLRKSHLTELIVITTDPRRLDDSSKIPTAPVRSYYV